MDKQSLIVDKTKLDLHYAEWVNSNNKAIFPKMQKGDAVVATHNDMPIGTFNWATTLYCLKCEKYHHKYPSCTE